MNEIRYKAVAKEFWTNWCEKNPVVSKYFDDTLEDFAKNGRDFFEIRYCTQSDGYRFMSGNMVELEKFVKELSTYFDRFSCIDKY